MARFLELLLAVVQILFVSGKRVGFTSILNVQVLAVLAGRVALVFLVEDLQLIVDQNND